MGQTSISNVKKVNWTKFEQNPLENNFSSLGPVICIAPFLFWLSLLPEWPNQLAYFTFISGFCVKLKTSRLEPPDFVLLACVQSSVVKSIYQGNFSEHENFFYII